MPKQEVKSEKELFLQRQEIHKQREKEYQFQMERLNAQMESIKECSENKINIDSIILDLLEELGFDRNFRGTDYLSQVISDLYHERRVFDPENKYFDFSDNRNNHFSFANEYYECGMIRLIEQIYIAIEQSFVKGSSINEIIYSIVNDLITQYDRFGRKLVYQRSINN